MSLPDLPANESLVAFGMPWHGLFVKPLDGAPYIELANGRRIQSERFISDGLLFGNTYLLDIGLPEPALQVDDEDAAFWNKAILSRYGSDPTVFSAWCMTASNTRMVKTEEGFKYLQLAQFTPPAGSLPARVVAYRYNSLGSGLDYDVVVNTGVYDPSKVLSGNHQAPRVLDITPDGRKWLISLSQDASVSNYPYRYYIKGASDTYGVGAIVEYEFSADFKSATSRILADYNDCQTGRDYTFSDGASFSTGSMSIGSNPSDQIEYAVGTSVATSSKTYVVGGWYSPTGEVQLVRLRMTRTETISISPPVARTDVQQYWSPRVNELRHQAQYKIGDGAFTTLLDAVFGSSRTPMTTTYRFSGLGRTYERTRENLPVLPSTDPRGEIDYGGGQTPGVVHQNPAMAGASGYSGNGWSSYFEFQCDWSEANKIMSCMARYRSESEFEYITSRAATPSGFVGSEGATGNIIPGHDRFAPNFDQAKWDDVSNFAAGAYNPVTQQIERQRFGGAQFTWV